MLHGSRFQTSKLLKETRPSPPALRYQHCLGRSLFRACNVDRVNALRERLHNAVRRAPSKQSLFWGIFDSFCNGLDVSFLCCADR
jgi:hypothetical protein